MNFESIHNYYEQLVINRILETLVAEQGVEDEDYLQDVACVALNQLPARYVRHDVDMAFYLTVPERAQMEQQIDEAITEASKVVTRYRSEDERHHEA